MEDRFGGVRLVGRIDRVKINPRPTLQPGNGTGLCLQGQIDRLSPVTIKNAGHRILSRRGIPILPPVSYFSEVLQPQFPGWQGAMDRYSNRMHGEIHRVFKVKERWSACGGLKPGTMVESRIIITDGGMISPHVDDQRIIKMILENQPFDIISEIIRIICGDYILNND